VIKTRLDAPDKCPYQKICKAQKCGKEGISGGFSRVDLILTCHNWDVSINIDDILESVNLPEGRHLSGVDAADKMDSALRKYLRSPKGKEAYKRYRESTKGQEARARHESTEKARLTKTKYYYSDKGQAAFQSRLEREKELRKIEKWLKENPGKTTEDYFKEHLHE
jgi:hypothetical protein